MYKKRKNNIRKPKWDVWKYYARTDKEGVAECKLCNRQLKSDRSYCLKLHLQKIHKAQSEAWKYFNYIDGIAICKQCQYRITNTSNGHNLLLHLQIAHDISLPDFEIELANNEKLQTENNEVVSISDDESKDQTSEMEGHDYETVIIANSIVAINDSYNDPSTSSALPQTSEIYQLPSQQNLPQISAVYHIPPPLNENDLAIEMNEKTLMSCVWGLMLEDDITPAMFAYKNMKSLLQPICKAIRRQENNNFSLNVTEAEKFVTRAAENVRINLTSNLDERLLSLKIDMDLQASRNTFCLTATFIQNGEIYKHLLGIIDLKDEPQITEQHIQHILNLYNISAKQIVHISSDFSKSEYHKEVKNSEYLKEIKKLEYFPYIKFGDIKIERYIGVIGQLCLLDVFKNPKIWEKFQECRNFCKFINESTDEVLQKFRKGNSNIPELDSPWKWGSTYKMMYDLQQARNKLINLKYKDNFNDYQDMWQFIDAFCKSLNHMQKSIVRFYSEEIHFGDFYAQWLKSKIMTTKMLSLANKLKQEYLTLITTEILECIEARTEEILSKDYFKACLYLDPRFQNTLKLEDKQQAADYLKKLYSRFDVFNPEELNEDSGDQTERKCFDEETEFLNEFLNPGDNEELYTKTIEIHCKIDSFRLPFKSVDINVLEFWQNLKELNTEMYELSAVCFAIPTTQIYNHYYHSHVYKPEHFNNLSTLTRDNLVTIRLNANLVRETFEIGNTQE